MRNMGASRDDCVWNSCNRECFCVFVYVYLHMCMCDRGDAGAEWCLHHEPGGVYSHMHFPCGPPIEHVHIPIGVPDRTLGARDVRRRHAAARGRGEPDRGVCVGGRTCRARRESHGVYVGGWQVCTYGEVRDWRHGTFGASGAHVLAGASNTYNMHSRMPICIRACRCELRCTSASASVPRARV